MNPNKYNKQARAMQLVIKKKVAEQFKDASLYYSIRWYYMPYEKKSDVLRVYQSIRREITKCQ